MDSQSPAARIATAVLVLVMVTLTPSPWGRQGALARDKKLRILDTKFRRQGRQLPGVTFWRYGNYSNRSRRGYTWPRAFSMPDVSFPPASAKSGFPPPEPPTSLASSWTI